MEMEISCEILLNVSLSSRNLCFGLPTICTYQNCYFEAIPSHKVEIDISCKILLNVSLSNRNARYSLATICTYQRCYFEAIPTQGGDRHVI